MKHSRKPSRKKPRSNVERTYRNIGIAFGVAAVIILLFVGYFSLSKTTITVTTNPQEISSSFSVSVRAEAPEGATDVLTGELVELTKERTGGFSDLTSVGTKEVKAEGEVTIINAYTKAQPLVATTRLLSDSGVLFRTQETITVPAGGETNVTVAADQPGEDGVIPPSRFTIVALWKGLQDEIYGRSAKPMTLGTRDVTVATEEDLREAKKTNLAALENEALQELDETIRATKRGYTFLPDAVTSVVLEENVDAKAGAEVESVNVATKARFTAVVFDEQELLAIAAQKLQEKRDENMMLLPTGTDSLTYSVESVDREKNEAMLDVTIVGLSKPLLTHPMFDRSRLTNKNADEIQSYLRGFDTVSGVAIDFSPFWVMRSPSLPDHIDLMLE